MSRDQKDICLYCKWWLESGDEGFGQCRRHAPSGEEFPQTMSNDWCGDFTERSADPEDRASRLLGTKYMKGDDAA